MGREGQTQQVVNGPAGFMIISSCHGGGGGWGLGWLGVCQDKETEQCSRSSRSGSTPRSKPAAQTRTGASRSGGHVALPGSVSSLCLHFGENPGMVLSH